MRERLAHIQFRGIIRERSVEPFLRLFKTVRERNRFKGVLLDISSGGGADVPSTDFYLAVKRLDQVKPVIATIGSIGASGAYLAATGARKIYAYPDSEVGSIGVVYPHFAAKELLTKLGIELELLHLGRHKDAYQGYRALTDEERTKLLAVAENSYRSFVELVARERKRPVEEILSLATGEFWSGTQALKLGLVDALGDREAALEDLSKLTGVPTKKVIRVTPPRPPLERFLSGGFSALGAAARQGIAESVSDTLDDLRFTRR
jgi:protease-4